MHPILATVFMLIMWAFISTGFSVLFIRNNLKHLIWAIPVGVIIGLFFSLLFLGSSILIPNQTDTSGAYSPTFAWSIFCVSVGLSSWAVWAYYKFRKANPREMVGTTSINFDELKAKKALKEQQANDVKMARKAKLEQAKAEKNAQKEKAKAAALLSLEQEKKALDAERRQLEIERQELEQQRIDLLQESESYEGYEYNDFDDFDSETNISVFQVIHFDYTNAKGERKTRRVKVTMAGYRYFDAIDLNINENRVFRYDRINGDVIVEDTGEVIKPRKLYQYFERESNS